MLSNEYFRNPGRRRASRGVTLFETIIAMGIFAILAAIAVPSFQYVTNANRIASEGNGLLGDLQFARAEAIKEGQAVSVCVSSDGQNCLANDYNWQKGWIVFSDLNASGKFVAGDTLLRVQSQFSGGDTFVANNNIGAVTFNREGFAAVANGTTMITLHTAPAVNAYTRCLTVGLVGLMAIQSYDGNICK
jgi:type IV fimbrial biogenesis protein FimT